jgi:capsular polysaccharide biosynthesis protein
MEPAVGRTAVGDFGNIIRDAGGGPGREPVELGPVTWFDEESRKAKLLAVSRRRWLLSTLLLFGVVGVVSLVSYLTPAKYSAEAVLVVPAVTANTPPPGNPDAAAKLAKTYAALIPLNSALIRQTSSKAQVDPVDLTAHISATNDSGTGIVRLTYVGTDKTSAAAVPTIMAVILTGMKPPAPVTAGSLRLITAPQSVTRSGGDLAHDLVLGAVLGLVVALAVAFALERTNPHVDGPTEVAEAVRVPVTTWNAPTTLRVIRLLRSWDTGTTGRSWQVALVPVGNVGSVRMLDIVSGVEALHRSAIESGRSRGEPRLNGAGANGAGANGAGVIGAGAIGAGANGAGANGAGANGAGVNGAGANGAGANGAGANGAGLIGAGANGAGANGAGLIGAGLIGAGPNGAGLIGAGPNGAGPNGAGADGSGRGAFGPSAPPRVKVVDLLGGDDVQELESADAIVLVVAPGVSLSNLSSTARRLRHQGAAPAWSIFIPGKPAKPGKGKGSTSGVVRHGDL